MWKQALIYPPIPIIPTSSSIPSLVDPIDLTVALSGLISVSSHARLRITVGVIRHRAVAYRKEHLPYKWLSRGIDLVFSIIKMDSLFDLDIDHGYKRMGC